MDSHQNAQGEAFSSSSGSDSPILDSVASTMKVDLLVNGVSDAWLLHDMPLPGDLGWIEYDRDDHSLTLVTEEGKMQDLGMKIPVVLGEDLQKMDEIRTVLMTGEEISDFTTVPLVTRET